MNWIFAVFMSWSRLALSAALVLSQLSIIQTSIAQEVYVQAGSSFGRGVLRPRGTDCFVLLPKHVVANTTGSIVVIGRNDRRANAELLRGLDVDLAILRLTDGDELLCNPWMPIDNFDALLRTQSTATLNLAERDGTLKPLRLKITSISKDYIYVESAVSDTQIESGNSGGAVYVSGALAGLMQDANRAYRVDNIRALTDDYFSTPQQVPEAPPALQMMDVSAAMQILDRATERRDGSMQGQIQAIATLIEQSFNFTAVDWSGLSLKGAVLANGNFGQSRMHMVDMTQADARRTNFSGAGLRFANLERIRMRDANLSESYAPFVDALGGTFDGANLSYANFLGGDFRGASFRNATLKGTSFAFADLRGAVFDNADLTDAHFAGAIFDETTSFVKATIRNTDFQGAAAATLSLTRAQSARSCRGPVQLGEYYTGLVWDVTLMEQWADTTTPTGLEFDDIYTDRGAFEGFKDRSLPICSTPERQATGVYLPSPAEDRIHLDRSYLGKRGRRALAVERVNRQLALLTENLRDENLLKGTGTEVQSWADHVEVAVTRTQLVSKPYMNGDNLLALFLATGALSTEELDKDSSFWKYAAQARFRLEAAVAALDGKLSDYDGWAQFFPSNAQWNDLPAETADLFRQWIIDRSKVVPMKLVTHRPLTPCKTCTAPKPGEYHIEWVFPSIPVGSDYALFNSWSSSQQRLVRESNISTGRVRHVRNDRITTMFVMPQLLGNYRIAFPDDLKLPEDGWLELDLEVLDVRGDTRNNQSTGDILVFVEPGEIRLRSGDDVLWTSRLTIIEAEAAESGLKPDSGPPRLTPLEPRQVPRVGAMSESAPQQETQTTANAAAERARRTEAAVEQAKTRMQDCYAQFSNPLNDSAASKSQLEEEFARCLSGE